MKGNQQFREAQMSLADATSAHGPEKQGAALKQAQIESTLALAQEQRTANLIAWHRVVMEDGDFEVLSALANEIETRLGGIA